ncbi:MAG: DUF411 domain-containing protein [Candidatus Competibacterales bacterium]|nr:DUF411 domain-containing protein [Candidatus Competibacterales bacterium]
MNMRPFLLAALVLLTGSLATVQAEEIQRRFGQPITVYKSPTCGCCAGWADYLKDNGFRVTVVEQYDLTELKSEYGIKPQLQSCHTAVVEDYAIEGHVPADDIWRLLAERPAVQGLSAPGMPQLSPGMNSIEPRDYDVLSFDDNGNIDLYSRY